MGRSDRPRLRRYLILVVGLAMCAGIVLSALDIRLTPRHYAIDAQRVDGPVRIVAITDVHGQFYDPQQQQLVDAIARQNPDIVLLGGDIYDDETPHAGATKLVERLAPLYPTFYVTGNHEWWSGEVDWITGDVRRAGATVLEGGCVPVEVRGDSVRVCGVDDPEVGETEFSAQIAATKSDGEHFTVLLAHRPERIDQYLAAGPDVVVSGHTHGGQVSIPFIVNGLFAPDQGLFPKYGGGRYEVGGTPLIISRGIVTGLRPRIWNPPEIVVLEVSPG